MTSVAFLGIPPVGGLRTFFINLRDSLAPNGIRVFWLGSGRQEAQAAIDRGIYGECPDGVVAAPEAEDDRARVKALIDYVRENQIPVVLLSSVAAATGAGLAYCLPAEVKRILVVHSITPMTYRTARALRDHVHCTVAVSPRIQRDLVRYHGFDANRTFCIPHGINTAAPGGERSLRDDGDPLRALFVGRVEDQAKGVLWLPEILRSAIAGGADVRLTVAGDGPDLPALRRAMARRGFQSRVEFTGAIPPDRVRELFGRHDAFLMPSRYEGLPYTLLEALGAGCVPVASRIPGVTDFVIRDGQTGFLFPVGSPRAAAKHLSRLARDPAPLAAAGAAAQADVKARFSLAQQAESYAALIHNTLDTPRPLPAPISPENFSLPRGFRPGWWHWLPLPIKNLLRCARERFLAGGGMQT
jgi:glycosyltransferase involved in cell wall biosynthesis